MSDPSRIASNSRASFRRATAFLAPMTCSTAQTQGLGRDLLQMTVTRNRTEASLWPTISIEMSIEPKT
jgi:hypothetical protein